MRQDCRGFCQC